MKSMKNDNDADDKMGNKKGVKKSLGMKKKMPMGKSGKSGIAKGMSK